MDIKGEVNGGRIPRLRLRLTFCRLNANPQNLHRHLHRRTGIAAALAHQSAARPPSLFSALHYVAGEIKRVKGRIDIYEEEK